MSSYIPAPVIKVVFTWAEGRKQFAFTLALYYMYYTKWLVQTSRLSQSKVSLILRRSSQGRSRHALSPFPKCVTQATLNRLRIRLIKSKTENNTCLHTFAGPAPCIYLEFCVTWLARVIFFTTLNWEPLSHTLSVMFTRSTYKVPSSVPTFTQGWKFEKSRVIAFKFRLKSELMHAQWWRLQRNKMVAAGKLQW